MRLRSLLFVPGDRPDRMAKAVASGADAVILDLEDSVAPQRKAHAREAVRAFLEQGERACALFVRVNPLDSDWLPEDIKLLGARPDGVVLPKAEGAGSLRRLAELAGALPVTLPPVLPIATETPAAIFAIGSYRDAGVPLAGLTWGAEDLPAAIGATAARDEHGHYTPPYEVARALTLFGAHAAGVAAIETVYPDFRDLAGLGRYLDRARRDGFGGMMAIHPGQVALINGAFTPTADEAAAARRIVQLFADSPDAGALQLDGRMIDLPHLKAARALLARL